MSAPRTVPFDRFTSIKVKLGALVAASVTVAAVVGTVAHAGGVTPWLAIPVTVGLALGVTQLLATGMTSPLREMTLAARRMARGDYDVRVSTSSRDEVGQLADAFNTMAHDLASVDRERRDLVATVSHELQTPLTALGLRLENLADGVEPPGPEVLEELLGQTRRLGTLVADLLDLARVEAGIRQLQPTEVEVAPFLRQLVAERAVPTRPVEVRVTVVPEDLVVRADRTRLRQLVGNLVDNATRHSPPDQPVTVVATAPAPGSATWVLEVGDRGPGVAQADRERAFERFGTLAGQAGGTGLGLAIARQVAGLHGGTVRFVDPPPDRPGALVRLELPVGLDPSTGSGQRRLDQRGVDPSTGSGQRKLDQRGVDQRGSALDSLFGDLWPERSLPGRRGLLVAAVAVGVLAGTLLPFRPDGLATFLVLLAAGGTVWAAARLRSLPFTIGCGALAVLLTSTVVLRDAGWIVTLCLFTAAALMVVAVTGGRTVPGFALAGLAWPLSALRGLPWLGRTTTALVGSGRVPALVRTLAWSLLGVGVFALLFASADALFAHWAGMLVPHWHTDRIVPRVFVAVAVGGAVLAAAYLALNPPRTADLTLPAGAPVARRYEWLVPVLLVDAVFAVFLVSQATVVFGGHEYVQRTAGITYAEYVHQGFAQLTVATALTLLVVWLAARKAPRVTPADRRWLRAALGTLCVLTLVVVASALYRLEVYQDAYGFTRLRLLVDVFEAWLGLIVLAVMVAGIRLRARWLPRLALVSGAAALAALALADPDAWIARHNIERYETTGKVDWAYLGGLSDDAVPEFDRLTPGEQACLVVGRTPSDDDWLSWNLGRARARSALAESDLPAPAGCAVDTADSADPDVPVD